MVDTQVQFDKNLKKNTLLLHHAIRHENVQSVQQYIGLIPINCPITDNGLTAFAYACTQTQNEHIFNAIVAQNPDLNIVDNAGRTALHHAAICSNVTCVQYLLSMSGSININAFTRGR